MLIPENSTIIRATVDRDIPADAYAWTEVGPCLCRLSFNSIAVQELEPFVAWIEGTFHPYINMIPTDYSNVATSWADEELSVKPKALMLN